ncbi:hypothetical protein TRVA0_028S01552 [Trichomonascus vanleenenianus]|uniref:proteasome regulatory particle lid subunit RPN13 n=1 Tax=Trichomonascus vanleenenianus TaxID=2268995 RepID=UPI003ECB39CE
MPSKVVSFKAGRVEFDEEAKTAIPKKGQGQVTITKNPDDPSLFSFDWEPRGKYKQTIADQKEELLLFPGDATWEHVKECDSGRVFALTFKSSGQRLLFWMQAPNEQGEVHELTAEDKQIAEKISSILDESNLEEEEDEEDEDVELSDVHPAPAAASEPADRDRISQDRLSELVNSLRNTSTSRSVPVTSIRDVAPIDELVRLVGSLPESELEQLYVHVPEGLPKTKEELVRVIRSSQFLQSVETFGSVLNGSAVGSLVSGQLQYPYSGEGIEGFLSGIRKKGEESKKSKKDDEDHEMN